jgi:serine/threonine-protein kinase RsbW
MIVVSADAESCSLVLRNELHELSRLSSWIEDAAQSCALDPTTSFAVQLCVDEAVANIVTHGDDAKASRIVVTLQRVADECVLQIEDDGPPFDPTRVADPKPATSLETAKIGGLGVHLMRKYSTGMHYERAAGQNRLRLTFAGTA